MSLLVLGAGLSELYSTLVNDWLGPAYLITLAVFAIMFLKDREFRKLLSYVAIATIVAVLIFAGNALFGSNGSITRAAKNTATKVSNIVRLPLK